MEKFLIAQDGSNKRICCEFPNLCPICNNSISPKNIMEHVNEDLNQVYFLFACPSCGKDFVTHYNLSYDEVQYRTNRYKKIYLEASYPVIPSSIEFDDCIKILSPKFCEIYNQSNSAEIYKLNEIAGMGYRKSLEFLIKDFCLKNNENDSEKIKKMPLSQVINEYIESEKIKKLSKASAWIGNDETHYVREWNDKNIDDLKRFIKSIVAFITYDISADEANEMIESKGK